MAKLYLKIVQLIENVVRIKKILESNKIELNLVTKFCLSDSRILNPILEKGLIKGIADSNAVNFASLPKNLSGQYSRSLIKTRISDIKSLPDMAEYARPTRLFVSDESLLKCIQELPDNINPEIVLIIENGDRKEGFFPDRIPEILEKYSDLNIKGISTNFSCLSGILPTIDNIKDLSRLAEFVANKIKKPQFLSVGGTVVYDLLKAGLLKGYVQEVRMGEGIFFAYDSSSGKPIPELLGNNFLLEGEILEICSKEIFPSDNNAGFTAIGEKSCVKTKVGIRKRAVLDFGILVASFNNLTPSDTAVYDVGQTFDFSVVDITDSDSCYTTGGFISFIPNYGAVSQAMINPFVDLLINN